MRVLFIPPSEGDFKKLLDGNIRQGGGVSDISVFSPTVRRGGGIFSTIARRVLPFLFRNIAPAATEFGKKVVSDVITRKRPLKHSVKKRGIQALKRVGKNILSGSGRVIKKKNKKKKRSKKKMNRVKAIKDVYSLLG